MDSSFRQVVLRDSEIIQEFMHYISGPDEVSKVEECVQAYEYKPDVTVW